MRDTTSQPAGGSRPSSPVQAVGWRKRLQARIAGSLGLAGFCAFVLVFLWAAVAFQVRREHEETLREAGTDLSNLTRAFAEHSAKSIEGADQAIRFIRNEYLAHPKDLDIAGYLRDKQIIGADYSLLSVIGPDGMVAYSSQPFTRVNLSDREHFQFHAKGRQDQLFVSKPVRGRVSHKLTIQLTRRVDDAGGRFQGVVVVSLSSDYLTSFYREVDLGPRGVITLVGYDGVVRARASQGGDDSAQDVSHNALFTQALREKTGTVIARSSIDHVERLWSFRALDDYKLMVITGTATADVLRDADRNERRYLVAAALMTLLVCGFSAGLIRRAARQRELLEELAASNVKANAANELKSRFLASVSHELRTPLNGILGYSELVREDAPDDDLRSHAEAIHQSATYLLKLVNAILDLAKIDSGRITLSVAAVDVAALLAEARSFGAGHAASRGVDLGVDVAAGTPGRIRSDRMRLLQILNNVIDNAIKFSDGGAVRVSACAHGDALRIVVADQGRGMDAAQLANAFERFHAGDVSAQVHEGQGAGIGLALARELAELLGGELKIESRPGTGTTVTLTVPTKADA